MLQNQFTLIANGTVVLVEAFERIRREAPKYAAQGARVRVKHATEADYQQYRRNVATMRQAKDESGWTVLVTFPDATARVVPCLDGADARATAGEWRAAGFRAEVQPSA